LSSIGDDLAIPELEKAMEDSDEDVSNSALIACEYLSYLRREKRTPNVSSNKVKIRL
jgi:HEAT repeat protein